MSRHHMMTRGVGRSVVLLTTVSLLFTGCAQAAVRLSATGQPSLSLAAPLTTLGCTSTGACITLGASGGTNAPTTVGQVRNLKGVWSALNVPPAPVAALNDAACGALTCLVGGTKEGIDLVWSINASSGAIRSLAGPAGGVVIRDLACASDARCWLLDQDSRGRTRFVATTTAGATWQAPRTLAWASNRTTAFDCTTLSQCDVATTSASHHVVLRETLNNGATWRLVATPPSWTSLSSLRCDPTCVALVTTPVGSALVYQVKSGWKTSPLSFAATSLACASSSTCVAVGHYVNNTAAMAEWKGAAVHAVSLSYVPTPLNHVACARAVCVATGVTTVVALQP
ncbi:MAG: hypothetical protein KGJ47_07980 [Acidobacteriota bacterium]|nr:hypothetical protein [Acidobacteriota bacterium]